MSPRCPGKAWSWSQGSSNTLTPRRPCDDLLEHYHADLVYHPRPEDPEPGLHRGREAFRKLIGDCVNSLTEINFDLLEVIEAEDFVIASTVLNGRGSASEIQVSDPYVFVYRFEDGLVVEGWEFKTMGEAIAMTASERR